MRERARVGRAGSESTSVQGVRVQACRHAAERSPLMPCRYAVSEDMKAAVAKLEEDEKAAEAAAEAGAAPVFKKRKAGQGGFRKKTGI